MIRLACIALCSAFQFTVAHANGDVYYSEDPNQITITISGSIAPKSVSELKRLIGNADIAFGIKPRLIVYSLNSDGGDLSSAIEMGRLMRSAPFLPAIEVRSGDHCLSSCVFLIAAGVYRLVEGRVGIHRPFFVNDKADSIAKQKSQSDRLEALVKQYFSEMGVSILLFDAMNRVPSSNINFLTSDQMEIYGLNTDDPNNDSALQARIAALLNISVGELVKRQQRANVECQQADRNAKSNCRAKTLAGK